jgi:hypothetical protein
MTERTIGSAVGRKGLVMFGILIGDLVGFAGGAVLSALTNYDKVGIAVSLLVPTMITFVGVLWVRGMREAIGAGFFIAYVCLMVSSIVIHLDATEQLAKDLTANFQTLMGTVVAFYFASAAVVEATKAISKSNHSEAVKDA